MHLQTPREDRSRKRGKQDIPIKVGRHFFVTFQQHQQIIHSGMFGMHFAKQSTLY